MKRSIKLLAVAVLGLVLASCSSLKKMEEMAENVIVTCDPGILEVVAGNIDAIVTVSYPADYFNPKAILEVTPVLVYEGGEAAMKPLMYQGEKVKDNYTVVSSDGQTVSERLHFEYVEGMEKAYLELRGVAYNAKQTQWATLPTKKVADGCNTTYMLASLDGYISYKADNYQDVITESTEGQIKYAVNSSDVASKELSSQSIKNFKAALEEIKANERATIKGTEVVAYASPEGGKDLNAKLSQKRSESAEKAWGKVMKNEGVANPEVASKGQDWEGFQELVAASNLEDKNLILRVLSMYSDPAIRESEIKNMSEVYTELKSGVLPELRRARFIANVEYLNYTSEELLKMIDDNIDVLDEEALLRAASLVNDTNKKVKVYEKAVDKYNSDRAQFNIGVAYLQDNKLDRASKAFAKVKTKDGELENALGIIDLKNGDLASAQKHFKASDSEFAKANQGVVDILAGNYAKAAQELADAKGCCHNTVLAYILTDQLAKAASSITCGSESCKYLNAIIAARQGKASDVQKILNEISDKDLKARATKDIEFADYR